MGKGRVHPMTKLTRTLIVMIPVIAAWAGFSGWVQSTWPSEYTLTVLALGGLVIGSAGVLAVGEWHHQAEMRDIAAGRSRRSRKPLIGKDYRPPTFDEFQAIVGDSFDSAHDPLGSFRAYDDLRLAMSCKAYDRAEAFVRLHEIAEGNRRMTETMRRLADRWTELADGQV